MVYQSLYREYRPKKFKDVVGQKAIIKILKNSIVKNKIAHAYLFCGPRGTGKTSVAKIFAHAVNCEKFNEDLCMSCSQCKHMSEHPDIIEIDAASNNGVEEIRKLIDKVKYSPMSGKYKVYIIDEVHMLSQGAFNALLKTLEEPPSHVIFILATTEAHKVLPTIVSRCQRFDFSRISDLEISKHLEKIMLLEGVKYEEGSSMAIARLSAGGLRNALTILEKTIVYSNDHIQLSDVYAVSGLLNQNEKIRLFEALSRDLNELKKIIDELLISTYDLNLLNEELIRHFKDMYLFLNTKNIDFIEESDQYLIEKISKLYTENEVEESIRLLLENQSKMRFSQNPSLLFEVTLIELYSISNKPSSISLDKPISVSTNHDDKTFSENLDKSQAIKSKEQNISKKVKVLDNKSKKDDKETLDVSRETSANMIDLSEEEIIELMVLADKKLRKSDESQLATLEKYKHDIEWMKIYRPLESAKIGLSSEDFIVLIFNEEFIIREMKEKSNLNLIVNFMEKITSKRRNVFIIDELTFKKAIQTFVIKSKEKSLPLKGEIEKEKYKLLNICDNVEDPRIKKASLLFGDKLEIKE